jgi:cytochrome c biogenesis protein CcmG/thiol:disulfide interchange protein DsbE
VRRNTLVLFIVLFLLAVFGWAGWANWEYHRQAAEARAAAASAKTEMVGGISGDVPESLSPLENKPAPNFTLEDISGKKVSLASYKGKAVLINFWATWCAPCKIETPWLIELRKQYAPQGFEILGVSADDLDLGDKQKLSAEKKEIADTAQQMHIPYPVLIDGDAISQPYGGVDELPTSFFVNRKGVIVAAQMGLTSQADIEANIRKALGEGK